MMELLLWGPLRHQNSYASDDETLTMGEEGSEKAHFDNDGGEMVGRGEWRGEEVGGAATRVEGRRGRGFGWR